MGRARMGPLSWYLLLCWGQRGSALTGYSFLDNQSQDRWIAENGEMNYEIKSGIPDQISSCFSLYINFNRYSSIVPILDFRNNYDKGYVDQFYGKPDQMRLLYKTDFKANGDAKKNIRLKWMAICLNMDYVTGKVELFINGVRSPQSDKKPIERPEDHVGKPLIIRIGHNYYDKSPLIGKIVDINIWDRLLTEDEMRDYTNCLSYVPTPQGNLVNTNTQWNITGSLITEVQLAESDILCTFGRTLFLPVRYRTFEEATGICEELGERGSFLEHFTTFRQYKIFHENAKKNKAIEAYCDHGGRYIFWLPYRGWDDISGTVNVTYLGDESPLNLTEMWRTNNPKSSSRPFCVVTRLSWEPNNSWTDQSCDLRESAYGWDRAPCSACTIPNNISKSIEFELRGLCDRTGFDTDFMVHNDEVTGLITYIGKKYTKIQYDQNLFQWNISVTNNPRISAVSYSDVSTMVIGKHLWKVSGDFACSTQDTASSLSLSSCNSSEFTCSDGVCIDLMKRCDNINDCRDKSDEADCRRVKMESTYQKFIVPPPRDEDDETKSHTQVAVSMNIESIMDISEVGGFFQVQFYLTIKWFETRLKFQNLKENINLNNFLPSETTDIWVPELVFENTEEKPGTTTDEKTTIKVEQGGNFKLNKKDENENTQYYDGAENQLIMTKFYNQRFLCDYQMAWYPFDVQRCRLVLSMRKAFAPFTKLVASELNYLGPEQLTKYEVLRTTIEVIQLNEGIEAIAVTIVLGRKLLGVIMNVFVPTTILTLIGFSTNFYKDAYFESIIAINLTAMLVLVALFVQVNSDLPDTAYVKMIDIWLIFNLIVPFLLIVIHTFMDTLRPDEDAKVEISPAPSPGPNETATEETTFEKPSGPVGFSLKEQLTYDGNTKVSVTSRRRRRTMRFCFHMANVILPFVCISFVVIFFMTGYITSGVNANADE